MAKIACQGSCGQDFDEKDMVFGPDPYQSEINDDDTSVWLCDDCYEQSRLDI